MTTDRRLAGAVLGLALFVAACGGSSATASPTAAPTAASQAAASQGPASEAPASSAAASEAPAVSMPAISLQPGAAGDLEAMLPSSVGSVTFSKTSIDGSQIAGAGTPIDTSKMDPLLSKYGKSIADVRMAVATGSGGTSPLPEMVYAIQLKGVPASDWASQLGSDVAAGPSMTIGGKSVKGTSTSGMTTASYTKDDIVFIVIAPDADAAGIFSALP